MYSYQIETLSLSPARWLYVASLAAATTFGLLVLMFKLVYMENMVIDETSAAIMPDVHWVKPDPVKPEYKQPEKPQTINETPNKPDSSAVDDIDVAVVIPKTSYNKPRFEGLRGYNLNAPIEQFIVTPKYPSRALVKGIEGYVELRFDVSASGATENIVVVRAEPQGVFESAAIAAAERWKFQPKLEEGKPVYFKGLSKLVTFEMQKS